MLSSGAHAVPSSACLKSQLRYVLLGLRRAPTTRPQYRPLQTFAVSYQEAATQIVKDESRDDKIPTPHVAAGESSNTSHDGYSLTFHTDRTRRDPTDRDTEAALEKPSYRHCGSKGQVTGEDDLRDDAKSSLASEGKTKPLYRHYSPEGRIIGRGKRRQRQSSQALETSTKLDDSPFKVVLLQDLPEETQKRLAASEAPILQQDEAGRTVVSAADIQAELNSVPDEKDIAASIDDLWPANTILEEKQYSELVQTLVERYSTSQLRRYRDARPRIDRAAKEAPPTDPSGTRPRHQTPPWLPGTTPLHVRRVKLSQGTVKSAAMHSKQKMVNDILRRTWDISVSSEEQAYGELEFGLAHGKSALLLQLDATGQPAYKAMIGSKLTLGSSRVEHYAPDNVLRITARRRDAEHIAETLQNVVDKVRMHVVKLNALRKPQHGRGGDGNGELAISSSDLEVIGQRTRCHLHWQNDRNLIIYSLSYRAAMEARRLAVCLLTSPEDRMGSLETEPILESTQLRKRLTTVPTMGTTALHYRYQGRLLSRLSMPERKERQNNSSDHAPIALQSARLKPSNAAAKPRTLLKYMGELDKLALPQRSEHPTSYWKQNDASPGHWESHIGLCLHKTEGAQHEVRSRAAQGPNPIRPPSQDCVFSHQVPKLQTALSYFVPQGQPTLLEGTQEVKVGPSLHELPSTIVALFIPSPFATPSDVSLPRIEMTLTRGMKSGKHTLSLQSMRAITQMQKIEIPCPAHSVDVRLSLEQSTPSDTERAWLGPEIRSFVQPLDAAFRAGDVLTGKAEVVFQILDRAAPTRRAKQKKLKQEARKVESATKKPDEAQTSTATYLFERLESRQTTYFVPNPDVLNGTIIVDPAVQRCLAAIPSSILLRYAEVDAGLIGGQRTELSLVDDPTSAAVKSVDHAPITAPIGEKALPTDTGKLPKSQDILVATSSLVELVTLANRGELETLKMPRKSLDWDEEETGL
ncbi:hypothetical protein B0A48_11360 [Cryoendolithus antarcticus]|uniref:Uncharacterized protein n=1 Tax=Cryoendolithus antarcticus TaxID=1507870 RepID=A0A1V8SVA0_9PEZI|nr:hypothetical protein B0A48_11360 [Cryoendolithus antarcticus]